MDTLQGIQLAPSIQDLINEALEAFDKGTSTQDYKSIPETDKIPSNKNPNHWLKIPDVVSVFVDMKDSTRLSASKYPDSTTGLYQLFTGTAVRIFHAFEAAYIDVRGDGVFALFNQDQPYRALAAAVTFKTFAHRDFEPQARAKTAGSKTPIYLGAHIGVDQSTVLVRKVGLSPYGGRTDRMNEVWAGKPVNMASKLAAMGEVNDLLVSDRYFKNVTHDLVRKSCGCSETGWSESNKRNLWKEVDVTDDLKFDFTTAHHLGTIWCQTHGHEFCRDIVALDD